MMRGFVILFGPMPFLILAILTLGLALAPAILVFQTMSPTINELNQWAQLPLLGILAVFSYYVYGFSLIFW